MSISTATERSLLSHEEFEAIRVSHYPEIGTLDVEELGKSRQAIRQLYDKARTVAWHKRREARGKGPARASGASGNAEHAARRKQVFAQALKRLNREIHRHEARTATLLRASMQRALAGRAGRRVHHPSTSPHAGQGLKPKVSTRRRTTPNPGMIGSISQANKNAQARRDA